MLACDKIEMKCIMVSMPVLLRIFTAQCIAFKSMVNI